jgi:hypothetical protein
MTPAPAVPDSAARSAGAMGVTDSTTFYVGLTLLVAGVVVTVIRRRRGTCRPVLGAPKSDTPLH